jgi:hypothetical protein
MQNDRQRDETPQYILYRNNLRDCAGFLRAGRGIKVPKDGLATLS